MQVALCCKRSKMIIISCLRVSFLIRRIDLAVSACNTLGRRLFVLGGGPESDKLRALAGPTVTVLGRVSDDEATRYASECRALLFPGEEDFGMAPLELAAAGRPTIAYRAGGALETIVEGTTGIFFDRQDVSSLAEAILRFETMSWDPEHSSRACAALRCQSVSQEILYLCWTRWVFRLAPRSQIAAAAPRLSVPCARKTPML